MPSSFDTNQPGDYVGFWRRSPGSKSEFVQGKVLKVQGNTLTIERVDTLEVRTVAASRCKTTQFAPLREHGCPECPAEMRFVEFIEQWVCDQCGYEEVVPRDSTR